VNKQLCQKDLSLELRKAVDEHIDSFIGEAGAARRVQLGMDYILEELVKEQFTEIVQSSFAQMVQVHALVRIDDATHRLIQQKHNAALVQARLGYTIGAFGLLLALLGTAYGYLKLDTATKGYYSGRLKLAATAVILTAAAATLLVVRQADPAVFVPRGSSSESPRLIDF
jgi:hypothetical protein